MTCHNLAISHWQFRIIIVSNFLLNLYLFWKSVGNQTLLNFPNNPLKTTKLINLSITENTRKKKNMQTDLWKNFTQYLHRLSAFLFSLFLAHLFSQVCELIPAAFIKSRPRSFLISSLTRVSKSVNKYRVFGWFLHRNGGCHIDAVFKGVPDRFIARRRRIMC